MFLWGGQSSGSRIPPTSPHSIFSWSSRAISDPEKGKPRKSRPVSLFLNFCLSLSFPRLALEAWDHALQSQFINGRFIAGEYLYRPADFRMAGGMYLTIAKELGCGTYPRAYGAGSSAQHGCRHTGTGATEQQSAPASSLGTR